MCQAICTPLKTALLLTRFLLKFSNHLNSCILVQLYLLEEASRVLADLCEPGDDVVEVEVGQGGVVTALPLHLKQQQVPAVHWR